MPFQLLGSAVVSDADTVVGSRSGFNGLASLRGGGLIDKPYIMTFLIWPLLSLALGFPAVNSPANIILDLFHERCYGRYGALGAMVRTECKWG